MQRLLQFILADSLAPECNFRFLIPVCRDGREDAAVRVSGNHSAPRERRAQLRVRGGEERAGAAGERAARGGRGGARFVVVTVQRRRPAVRLNATRLVTLYIRRRTRTVSISVTSTSQHLERYPACITSTSRCHEHKHLKSGWCPQPLELFVSSSTTQFNLVDNTAHGHVMHL